MKREDNAGVGRGSRGDEGDDTRKSGIMDEGRGKERRSEGKRGE